MNSNIEQLIQTYGDVDLFTYQPEIICDEIIPVNQIKQLSTYFVEVGEIISCTCDETNKQAIINLLKECEIPYEEQFTKNTINN